VKIVAFLVPRSPLNAWFQASVELLVLSDPSIVAALQFQTSGGNRGSKVKVQIPVIHKAATNVRNS
jgi:hypothetical protein